MTLPLSAPPIVQDLRTKLEKRLTLDIPGIPSDDSVTAISYDRKGRYIITGSSKVFFSPILNFPTGNFPFANSVRESASFTHFLNPATLLIRHFYPGKE